MPRRAPLHMRDMLSARNSSDRWKGATLNSHDKLTIERALVKLGAGYNDADSTLQIMQLIRKVQNLPV